MQQTLVLGIGNTLLTDDGIGVQVVKALQAATDLPPGVECLDAGTLSFTLLGLLNPETRLIVVDAARLGLAPGAITCVEGQAMDQLVRRRLGTMHEVGLADVLDMARLTDQLPERRALIAIQTQSTDWGDAPSPTVAAALHPALDQIHALIRRWHQS